MCHIRIYIELQDFETEKVLCRAYYIGVAGIAANAVEKRILSLLTSLKGDGFYVRSAIGNNDFVAIITLLNTIGETDPAKYLDVIRTFSSESAEIPKNDVQYGFLITTKDHSSLESKDIESLLNENNLKHEIIAETTTITEHGAGDGFSQFIIGLAVEISAKALGSVLSMLRNKLGASKYGEIIVSRFRFVTLIDNLIRQKSIPKEELRIIEMRRLEKQKYEITFLSKSALLYVRCDHNANVLGISEHRL